MICLTNKVSFLFILVFGCPIFFCLQDYSWLFKANPVIHLGLCFGWDAECSNETGGIRSRCYVFTFLAIILHMSFVDFISLFLKPARASEECLINSFSTDNKNFLDL